MPKLVRILSSVNNLCLSDAGLSAGANVVDEVSVDQYGSVGWTLTARRSDGVRARYNVEAVHDGTLTTDASTGVFEISGGAVISAAADQVTLAVALSGSGVNQVLQLVVTVTAGTWYCDVSRSTHVGSPR